MININKKIYSITNYSTVLLIKIENKKNIFMHLDYIL